MNDLRTQAELGKVVETCIIKCLVVLGKVQCWHYFRVPSKLSMILVATVKSAAMTKALNIELFIGDKKELTVVRSVQSTWSTLADS